MKFYPKEKILISKGYKYIHSMRISGKGRGKCFFKDGIFVEIYTKDIIIMYPDRLWIKSHKTFTKLSK